LFLSWAFRGLENFGRYISDEIQGKLSKLQNELDPTIIPPVS
jgi:hypothetical protein